jgi:hypothetical protein
VAPLEKPKEELPLESLVDKPKEELPLVEMAPPTQVVPMVVASMEYVMELPMKKQPKEVLPMVVAPMEFEMELLRRSSPRRHRL